MDKKLLPLTRIVELFNTLYVMLVPFVTTKLSIVLDDAYVALVDSV